MATDKKRHKHSWKGLGFDVSRCADCFLYQDERFPKLKPLEEFPLLIERRKKHEEKARQKVCLFTGAEATSLEERLVDRFLHDFSGVLMQVEHEGRTRSMKVNSFGWVFQNGTKVLRVNGRLED